MYDNVLVFLKNKYEEANAYMYKIYNIALNTGYVSTTSFVLPETVIALTKLVSQDAKKIALLNEEDFIRLVASEASKSLDTLLLDDKPFYLQVLLRKLFRAQGDKKPVIKKKIQDVMQNIRKNNYLEATHELYHDLQAKIYRESESVKKIQKGVFALEPDETDALSNITPGKVDAAKQDHDNSKVDLIDTAIRELFDNEKLAKEQIIFILRVKNML